MPVIVELRLRAQGPRGSRRPSGAAGPGGPEPTTRQLHGLACALFEGTRTADDQHVASEKPFTIWPLRQAPGGWLLRGAWLPPGFPQTVMAAAGEVRLGSVSYTVTDLALRTAAHDEMAAAEPADGARLTFLSPAYFSQNGTAVTDPDPRLIAGSWRRRWNASLSPSHDLLIDAALWRDMHLALHVTGSGITLQPRDTGYRQQPGMTGTLTLRLESGASLTVRQAFAALASFAEYCGTGALVTHGFGATKTTLLRTSWNASPTTNPARAEVLE
jgi:CRISPR-associated endoribonuclease Cas6